MVAANSAHSQDYLESLRLLRELHLLTLAGKDQTEEGDAIRDAMEKPWWRLSEAERERIEGLSADLYSIGENRVAPAKVPDSIAAAFEAARASANWDEALAILRRHEQELPTADVAVIRGIAWDYLQQSEIASFFFAEAARLQPHDVRLQCMYLRALVRSRQLGEARNRATRLAKAATDALELLLAADVLFDCATNEHDQPDLKDVRYVADLAERAWAAWNARPLSEGLSRVACAGFLSAAISLELLGEHQRAREVFETAQTFHQCADYPAPARSKANGSEDTAEFVSFMTETRARMEAAMPAFSLT